MDQTSAAGAKRLSACRGKNRVLPDGRVPQGKRKRAVGGLVYGRGQPGEREVDERRLGLVHGLPHARKGLRAAVSGETLF